MLRDKIAEALKTALKSQDKLRTGTLRLIQAAVQDRDIKHRGEGKDPLTDAEILQVLTTMVKQREESARVYDQGGRAELALQERNEIEIIKGFMPQQMGDEAVKNACQAAIGEIGAEGLRDMGKCMAVLKEKYPGQMDFAKASGVVKELLK